MQHMKYLCRKWGYMINKTEIIKRLVRTSAAVLSITVLTGFGVYEGKGISSATAGTSREVEFSEKSALGGVAALTAGKTKDGGIVSESETAVKPVAVSIQAKNEWDGKVICQAAGVNVRSDASADAAVAGSMDRGAVGTIESYADGWYLITSGNLHGYISADFVKTGADAEADAAGLYPDTYTINVDAAKVRSEADTNSSIVTVLYRGSSVQKNSGATESPEWTGVTVDGKTGYIRSEFLVKTEKAYKTGLTNEEKAAIVQEELKRQQEEARKAAEAKEKAAKAANTSVSVTVESTSASASSADDLTLMAAVCQLEAGGSYDGMLAVASVIMNRVRSSRWPSTVSGVIYQSGQFYPRGSKALNSVISRGPSAGAIRAAEAALAGTDTVNGCMSFRSAGSGYAGTVIGGNVFF